MLNTNLGNKTQSAQILIRRACVNTKNCDCSWYYQCKQSFIVVKGNIATINW